MPDYDSNKVTIIFMVINNSFLLVVMVIGLLRMRIHGTGTCSLGQLLWKQVKAQRNLRVLKEFDRMSVLDPDTKIRA